MYAIIQTGSKQYRVAKGDVIEVELLDSAAGHQIDLTDVLLVASGEGAVRVGSPNVAGSVVRAEVLQEVQGPKVYGVKYKRRKNNYRKFGHRQRYTQLKIVDIVA